MADTHPEDTERLHAYWAHGEGAAKIAWGSPGDFDRCRAELGKYIRDADGYCNLMHHAVLGIWPAQHAKELEGRNTGMGAETRAAISTADQNDLPDSAFAFIQPGGTKDSSGKTMPRSLRHFPIHDAAHVRNALSRAPQSPFGDKAMPKIKAAAAKLGVQVGDDSDGDESSRSYEWLPLTTGAKPEMRGVDESGAQRIGGYAAVFGKLSRPLRQGPIKRTFVEMVDLGAFNESRSRGWKRLPEPMTGFADDVLCRLNHQDDDIIARAGRTLDLATNKTGLDYTATPMPEHRSLQMVRRGDIQASSFMFNCDIGVGDHWELTDQEFPVRVLDTVELIDVAPVTNPAYPSATAGLRSLAAHFDADFGEVRNMAESGELRRFFIRTDNRGPAPAAPLPTGPQAMMRLMEKRYPKI